jgi:histidyl-tRNA synthetase
VELVQLYDDVFTKLNIPNVDICINNRKVLSGMVELMGATDLFDQIVIALDKLVKIGIDMVKEEMESKLENIKNISVGKTETKQEHKDEVLENKHKDLFDELFGEKS